MTTATSGTTSPLTSPLHDRHVALGAKMADFGGWDMPIEYPGGGVVAEHTAVRERVGVFDVSHLGKASVTGPGAADFVNACLTNDVRRIQPGSAQYTLCCDDAGGVVDDLIVYLKSDDDVFLIPNAANTAEVVRRLQAAAPEGITVTNLHRDYGVIAVQGTKSDEVLESLGLPTGHDYMSFVEADWQGRPGHRVPHRLHRRARLRARARGGTTRPHCGTPSSRRSRRSTASRAASARATRCAPRWATRCTDRTCRCRSLPCRPAPAGPWAGRRTPSGARPPSRPSAPTRRASCAVCS